MRWQADYNVVVDGPTSGQDNGKTDVLDLVGWITMRNQSGKTFDNARIKLLAGDGSKIQEGSIANRLYAAKAMAAEVDSAAPGGREKSFAEFPLYTLEPPTTRHH